MVLKDFLTLLGIEPRSFALPARGTARVQVFNKEKGQICIYIRVLKK
jgi:hypothetical protein